MANELQIENAALHKRIEQLQSQVEGLQLRIRFGLERFAGSDDEIRFYTRFASYKQFQCFWKLVGSAVKTKMIRVTNTKASIADSDRFHTYMV
ncbi:hypothetical protein ILYODFUR_033495 [Ilyodon furcidens]|uniref:Uncharacterized protein n=1 Tax=Ilyodon furcidens TaxID=33524 RepID=A0ABV0TDI7_9TELE